MYVIIHMKIKFADMIYDIFFFGKTIVIVIDYGKKFKKRLEDKTITTKKIY